MQARDLFGLVGTVVADRFRVERVLGEGGYGVVYAGTHLLLSVPVAIKCLKPAGFTPEERSRGAQAFLREARILFGLSHPAIVRLYDVGVTPDRQVPYAVLELLTGTTVAEEILRRASAHKHFDRDELGAIFGPILEAVSFAHERGVVHRDLKPSNMMLVSEGSRMQPKVLDFGTARVDEAGRAASVVLGGGAQSMTSAAISNNAAPTGFTPLYAAPEQWDKSLGPTSPRTDVFALGLTLAEACLLGYPFETSSGLLSIFKHALDERSRPLIADARPDLPIELEAVILRALRVDPAARYPDARELLASFRAALKIVPATAPMEKPLGHARATPPPRPARPMLEAPPPTVPAPPTIPPLVAGRPSAPTPPPPTPQRLTPPPMTYPPVTSPPMTPAPGTSPPVTPGALLPFAGTTQPHALASVSTQTQPGGNALPWVIGAAGLFVAFAALALGAFVVMTRTSAAPPPPAPEAPATADAGAPKLDHGGEDDDATDDATDDVTTPGASATAPARRGAVDAGVAADAGRASGGRAFHVIAASVSGGGPFWTPGELLGVAEAHNGELTRCAAEASRVAPDLEGEVSVTVSPDKHGVVGNVMCSGRTRGVAEDAICGCFQRRIGAWKFPPSHGKLGMLEAASFIYTFRLVAK